MGRNRAQKSPFWATAIDRMTPGVRGIVRELDALIDRSPDLAPYLWMGSGWRSGSQEHSSGRAIDIIVTETTGRRPTDAEHKAAMLLIDWLIANGRALGIQWILYSTDGKDRTRSYNMDRGSWNNLANRGSISANHVDHMHVYFKVGASWPSTLNGAVIGSGNAAPAPAPRPGPPSTGAPGKTVAQMATEVIAGRHGNGHTNRQRSLGIDAATYAKVRAEVNRRTGTTASTPAPAPAVKSVSQMATEVIDGRHGNGHANRRRSLGVSASVYEQVRAEVNRRVSGSSKPAGKSITQMASEVIQGRHGNGHATRRRSLGVDAATYARVRAEVNRRV